MTWQDFYKKNFYCALLYLSLTAEKNNIFMQDFQKAAPECFHWRQFFSVSSCMMMDNNLYKMHIIPIKEG